MSQHPEHDQRLAAGAVGEPAGCELAAAPDGGVDGSDGSDLRRGRAVSGEVERGEAPGERVVQVVDETGLRAGPLQAIAECYPHERSAEGRLHGALAVALF